MPNAIYVTIVEGFMLTLFQLGMAVLGACAYTADEHLYPELDEANDFPPDAIALLDMNGEHLKEPVLEVQWALGWMLVVEQRVPEEPPRKRGLSWVTRATAKPKVVEVPTPSQQEDAEAIAMASRLTQFFALLPKLPGKHGAPMLSLALESVAESGLWRRGVLLPHNEDGQTPLLARNFSWPELFGFVHERLPTEMRFRLWRCSLQICVSSPELAPLAEIPFALASAANDAPPGASRTPELLQEALELGADPEALGPLCARLPVPEKAKTPPVGTMREPKLLLSPAEGVNAENERRAELASLGINIEASRRPRI
eukprot:g30406.t1